MTATTFPVFDAVIVGAGLAGSTAAVRLARAGWTVALIERQRFPRRKVCGECLAASNLPLLHRLGVGDAFASLAGPALRRVTLMHGEASVTAGLPPAQDRRFEWGRALGRETLDGLLMEQARREGVTIFQPTALQSIEGAPGDWQCELRSGETSLRRHLRARLVIDAHGSWEELAIDRPKPLPSRSDSDLFAFKANFVGTTLAEGAISVLALDGGYGGMVVADGGLTTVACCIRRDRLGQLRRVAPGLRAGDVVQAWLLRECKGVKQALRGSRIDGRWLSSGPLDPGVHLLANDRIFRIGNAAGEAHPILGEGMSMALQSADLLASVLLGPSGAGSVPTVAGQRELQLRYRAAWRSAFVPRLRLAAAFAHTAMRPQGAAWLMRAAHLWPGLLTVGARWGGKVRLPDAQPGASTTVRCRHHTLPEEFS
jgi:2-polyprenyl-6-methoxyphenol hydroxylase-like FAD-dependent oxidoreductase